MTGRSVPYPIELLFPIAFGHYSLVKRISSHSSDIIYTLFELVPLAFTFLLLGTINSYLTKVYLCTYRN